MSLIVCGGASPHRRATSLRSVQTVGGAPSGRCTTPLIAPATFMVSEGVADDDAIGFAYACDTWSETQSLRQITFCEIRIKAC